ncbi:hypothetical protein FRC08_006306 [Ceratobasidium sp. 394]|nr:hypothetical protein FRC08_006306 [Ceratobasidium sp. 394]
MIQPPLGTTSTAAIHDPTDGSFAYPASSLDGIQHSRAASGMTRTRSTLRSGKTGHTTTPMAWRTNGRVMGSARLMWKVLATLDVFHAEVRLSPLALNPAQNIHQLQ